MQTNGDITGQRYGRLLVLGPAPRNKGERARWIVKCDYGATKTVNGSDIKSGRTNSCGCLMREISKQKIAKVAEEQRKMEPRIASAKRAWRLYPKNDPECTITFEQFLELSQLACTYCGVEPSNHYNYFSEPSCRSSDKSKAEGLFSYNGLDRVDSSKAHTLDNVVTACKDCNRAKNDRPTDVFLAWAMRVRVPNILEPVTIPSVTLPSNKYVMCSIRSSFGSSGTGRRGFLSQRTG
jgi:5-methylcytosine-specific restriction endonuclease McrA